MPEEGKLKRKPTCKIRLVCERATYVTACPRWMLIGMNTNGKRVPWQELGRSQETICFYLKTKMRLFICAANITQSNINV